MFDIASVTYLHVEQTTRCNASCPGCLRNNNGYGIANGLEITDLSVDRLAQVLDQMPKLQLIEFSGAYGDCITSTQFMQSIDVVLDKKIPRVQIRTNGGLKTVKWWSELGKKLSVVDHHITFALDGLADTHHIYRQGVNYDKVIENATAFITAGGRAHWQFIPFAHNEHQIIEAKKLSQRLGFEKFILRKDVKYRGQGRHYQTGLSLDINPWSQEHKLGKWRGTHMDQAYTLFDTVKIKDCMHLGMPSAYLSAAGLLTPCCYLTDVDIHSVDISNELTTAQYRKPCLTWCGSEQNQ